MKTIQISYREGIAPYTAYDINDPVLEPMFKTPQPISNLRLIAAKNYNRVIGRDNKLPWKCKEDMAFFKNITTDHTVVMGRKTFESLGSRPLPKRHNIVLTNSSISNGEPYPVEKGVLYMTLKDLLALVPCWWNHYFWVIGGSEVYRELLPYCKDAFITTVHNQEDGDVFFPREAYPLFNKVKVITASPACVIKHYTLDKTETNHGIFIT